MPGHNMAGMTAPTEPPASHARIPPAKGSKKYARAVAGHQPTASASSASATIAAAATIRILPGAGNTNATDTYSPCRQQEQECIKYRSLEKGFGGDARKQSKLPKEL